MTMDNNDAQMIFGDLRGLKLHDICLTGEEKLPKNLTQATYPDRGSNPCPLRDKRACYHLLHSGGPGGVRNFNLCLGLDVCVLCVLSCVVSDGGLDIVLTRHSGRSALVYLSSVLVQRLLLPLIGI